MRLIICILLLFVHFNLFAVRKDPSYSFRRVTLEIGNTYVDMYGNDNDFYQKVVYGPKFFSVTAYVYKPYFISAQYNHVYVGTHYYLDNISTPANMTPGSTLAYYFRCYRLNVGRTFKLKNFTFNPHLSFNRRFGLGELFFVDTVRSHPWGGTIESRSEYRSNGVGIGLGINYLIRNRITLGIEANFNYNFEKINPQPGTTINPSDYGFKPSRWFSLLNYKIGYLLF